MKTLVSTMTLTTTTTLMLVLVGLAALPTAAARAQSPSLADLVEELVGLVVPGAVGAGGNVQKEIAAFGDDIDEHVDDLAGGFISGVGYPGPAAAGDDAGFPGIGEQFVGDAVFGGEVILVGAGDGAIDDDEAGLFPAGFAGEFGHADILVAIAVVDPAAVVRKLLGLEPDHRSRSVLHDASPNLTE